MRKRKGVTGIIFSVLGAAVVLGFILAVLTRFNGDFVAAFEWLFNSFMDLAYRISDIFTNNEGFQRMTSTIY